MRTLALPKEVEHWSLTTLREKLVKIGAIDDQVKTTGGVRLNGEKNDRMGFRHVQITKIRPSDASVGKTIPTVAEFGYDRHEPEGYLGNVGLGMSWR